MKIDEGYVKTTIKIPLDTWTKIRGLQQTRRLRSIQHAVELGLQWVVATSQERRKAELKVKTTMTNIKNQRISKKLK